FIEMTMIINMKGIIRKGSKAEKRLREVADDVQKMIDTGEIGKLAPIDVSAICYVAKNLVAKTIEAYGKLDILVNNAGILEEGLKPIDRVLDEDMDRIIDTNTKGTMYCMREACTEMEKTGQGSIVNVASVAGVVGCGGAAYVASKSAIIGVTRHTALRFAGKGIRCNAICPSTIVTPMVANMKPDNMDPDMFGNMAKHADLRVQPCMPEDVANIICFFASDESRAITGQTIVSDFGSTL
ncbi:MAG: SDR family oxidoreductase, partial [Lachnospiraceae bacterium]|nr:SDR family oxidoreductase [Lachnospiraceae bacterium]